jgi:hypothetical protein
MRLWSEAERVISRMFIPATHDLWSPGDLGMEYEVLVERDEEAGVWFVQKTNVPGLALEDPTFDGLLGKLPDAVSWLLKEKHPKSKVPVRILKYESVNVGG